jgi:RimJ/RimL family protein N-acetyltransferase
MPEAVSAVIDWAFRFRDLARIYTWTDLDNERSWRVMEKVGMRREGVFRSARPTRDGGRCDHVYYAVLRSEWGAARAG